MGGNLAQHQARISKGGFPRGWVKGWGGKKEKKPHLSAQFKTLKINLFQISKSSMLNIRKLSSLKKKKKEE